MPVDNAQPRRNWWSRNWKWFVPVLCVIAFGLFMATLFAFVTMIMNLGRSTVPYQEALRRTRASPAVVTALGSPIEPAQFFSGQTTDSGSDGTAVFQIALHGPKGGGTLSVRATKTAGVWHYTVMSVTVSSTQQHIDLLQSTEKVRYDNPNTFQARARISNATYAYTPANTSSSITPSPP